jgi:hypothetical protein
VCRFHQQEDSTDGDANGPWLQYMSQLRHGHHINNGDGAMDEARGANDLSHS